MRKKISRRALYNGYQTTRAHKHVLGILLGFVPGGERWECSVCGHAFTVES